VDYQPKYFLVNGTPYSAATAPIPAGEVGATLLLRVVSCGLRTHAPTFLRSEMTAVAEDGFPYTYPQKLSSLMLPAGKTLDAIVVPPAEGDYPVFDRTLCLTNAGYATPGGMLRILSVAAAQQAKGQASGGSEVGKTAGDVGQSKDVPGTTSKTPAASPVPKRR